MQGIYTLRSVVPRGVLSFQKMSEPSNRPDWVPDWIPDWPPVTVEPPEDSSDVEEITRAPSIRVLVTPSKDRTVDRKLRGIHLFMISINGTLGTGLYWRGGMILELGGPLAVLLSFLLVGFLSWAVMQCITEMLCIWPIPGALSVYVSEFVDKELGIAVGCAYWFTYSASFSALIATSAAEFNFWRSFNDKGIDGGIVYLCIPLLLVFVNALAIELYGLVEVVTGTIKILFLAVIIGAMIAINLGAGPTHQEPVGTQYWDSPTDYDSRVAQTWGVALLMSLSIATFAYVGVELVAASALEAQWPRQSPSNENTGTDISLQSYQSNSNNFILQTSGERQTVSDNYTLIGKTVKFSAIYISILATVAYTLSGLLATLDLSRSDPNLPSLSWAKAAGLGQGITPPGDSRSSSASAFVIIAQESGIRHLDDLFNAFLVFTCLSCASTNLYVASRTLFGLTSRLDGGNGQPRHLRVLAWFGKTNNRKVPMRATLFSAIAFWWVPFLQLSGGTSGHSTIGKFVEVLGNMATVGVLIVWACECLAFIRFYHCIRHHRSDLEQEKISQVLRWREDYPYRSHAQPWLAYGAFIGCVFILIVANGAPLWDGFHPLPFLSSYLTVSMFLVLWVLLKLVRGAKWCFEDLSSPRMVIKKLRDLHDIRQGAT